MYARLVRILTAVVVVALCGPAVLRGSDIIRFWMVDNVVDEDVGPTEAQIETLRRWVTISGLAVSARESSLPYVNDRTRCAITWCQMSR
jgi:hypothetical protein